MAQKSPQDTCIEKAMNAFAQSQSSITQQIQILNYIDDHIELYTNSTYFKEEHQKLGKSSLE